MSRTKITQKKHLTAQKMSVKLPAMKDEMRFERAKNRINDSIKIDGDTGCAIWQGAVDSDGFPIITLNGKRWRVHRFRYMLENFLQESEQLSQACGNHLCVEPKHMTVRGDKVYWPGATVRFYQGYTIQIFRVKRGKWAWRIGGFVSKYEFTSQKLALENAKEMIDDPDLDQAEIFNPADDSADTLEYRENGQDSLREWEVSQRELD